MSRCHKFLVTTLIVTCLLLAAGASSISVIAQAQATGRWWSPGDGRTLPPNLDYANADGVLGVLNTAGAIDTKGHPFFEPIGTNGRACVTCHQPSDAMSLSAANGPRTLA